MSGVLEITGVCANNHCGYAVTGVHPTHCCVGCYKHELFCYPRSDHWRCHGLLCKKISDASRLFVEAMELRQMKEELEKVSRIQREILAKPNEKKEKEEEKVEK